MSEQPLTWGDLMVAAMAASCAVGKDTPVSKRTAWKDIEAILDTIGRGYQIEKSAAVKMAGG